MSDLIRVRHWADALITLHLDETWTFAFDNAKRRAGLCDYTNKRISVSRYLAAPGAGQGPRWKAVARDLGYEGGVTHRGETATELAPWVGHCPAGHVAYRHRRPSRPTSCVKCAPRFDDRHLFRWVRREITTATRRAASTPR